MHGLKREHSNSIHFSVNVGRVSSSSVEKMEVKSPVGFSAERRPRVLLANSSA